MEEIDYVALKDALIEFYGSGMFALEYAQFKLIEVDSATSNSDLERLALEAGFSLADFIKSEYKM